MSKIRRKRLEDGIRRKMKTNHARDIARATAASLLQDHLDEAKSKEASLDILVTTCEGHVGIDVKDNGLKVAVWTEWERLINELTPQE